jgi:hypothetical protein
MRPFVQLFAEDTGLMESNGFGTIGNVLRVKHAPDGRARQTELIRPLLAQANLDHWDKLVTPEAMGIYRSVFLLNLSLPHGEVLQGDYPTACQDRELPDRVDAFGLMHVPASAAPSGGRQAMTTPQSRWRALKSQAKQLAEVDRYFERA